MYRVNKKTARALRQEVFGPERIAEPCVDVTYKSSPASESSDTSVRTSGREIVGEIGEPVGPGVRAGWVV